jgi:hypothetical protein
VLTVAVEIIDGMISASGGLGGIGTFSNDPRAAKASFVTPQFSTGVKIAGKYCSVFRIAGRRTPISQPY